MKKFICVISAIILALGLFSGITKKDTFVNAAGDIVQTKIESYLSTFMCLNNEVEKAKIQDRRAGTLGERQAAANLYNLIMLNSQFLNFEPVNDGSTTNGVQNFQFTSSYSGLSATSQNLRFVKKSSVSEGKKVIISTGYDNTPYYDSENDVYNDNVSSAGNVAVLLYLTEYLSGLTEELLFDVEIVFFGASQSNLAGAYAYTDNMTKKEIENTVLFINLDQITLGQNLYMYVNEFNTAQEDYISDVFKGSDVCFSAFNPKTTLNSVYSGVYDYSHRGLEGNNVAFMEKNITSLNVFSGYYEKMGIRTEYEGSKTLIGTSKDNYAYAEYTYGFDNLGKVAQAVSGLIVSDSLLYNMTKNKPSSAFQEFWTNDKYPIMFMIIIAFVFGLIYVFLYYGNKKKAETIIKQKGVSGILQDISRIEKEIDKKNRE